VDFVLYGAFGPPGDWTAVQTTVTAAPGIFVVQVVVNIIIGAVMGFASDLVMQAIYAAGSMMTNQIGLSSAMMMDPTTRQQSMILQTMFSFIALVVFLEMDGSTGLFADLSRASRSFPCKGFGLTCLPIFNWTAFWNCPPIRSPWR
jgi:flagellar biosynthetic protein FliR